MFPNKIVAVTTLNTTEFSRRYDSVKQKHTLIMIWLAFSPYIRKAPPTTITMNNKIKIPLAGSVANACTDVKTPERTKNVLAD